MPANIALLTDDPENKLLWRFRPQRLDAEQARDTLLVLAGEMKDKPKLADRLGQRAYPFLELMKQGKAKDEPVMWGV